MSPKAKGVYSTEAAAGSAGMGPRRAAPSKRLWLVWEHDENYVEVQPINKNLVPAGQKRLVPVYEFAGDYTREPEFVVEADRARARPVWHKPPDTPDSGAAAPEAPAREKADDALDELLQAEPSPKLDQSRKVDLDPEPFDDAILEDRPPRSEPAPPAEPRPKPPPAATPRDLELQRVEREARSAFGLGLSHLKRGNAERARALFEEVAAIKADFEPEHKHMFNEFGINLRKSDMPDVALKHYQRALRLSPEDENLHHNLARIYWELGDLERCERELRKSLDLNPELGYSKRFLRFLKKQEPARKRGIFHDILPRKGGKGR